MELIHAVKFDAEFLEYFENILVTIIPKITLESDQPTRLKEVDKIIRALLTDNKWVLERCNADWVTIIRMAVKHYEPEGTASK